MSTIEWLPTDGPIKAVIADVPPFFLEWRQKTGADRWDEMWKGVLHMPPMPNRDHQDLVFQLTSWLHTHWARTCGGRATHERNLSPSDDWRHDYRCPDICLLTADRMHFDRNEYIAGPPAAVIEIVSPGDYSRTKLEFYAELGVPEVWLIDRDTKEPEIFVLAFGAYQPRAVDADGWLRSPVTGVEFRSTEPDKLTLRLPGDIATQANLPE